MIHWLSMLEVDTFFESVFLVGLDERNVLKTGNLKAIRDSGRTIDTLLTWLTLYLGKTSV